MSLLPNKQSILLGIIILLLLVLPVSLLMLRTRQETRSHATAAATLYFTPESSSSAAMQYKTGDSVSFDLMIDPGTNLPSLLRLQISYDPAVLQPSSSVPFLVNSAAFPTIIEGPIVSNGNILVSISIGSDSTKAIQTVTKVGTLTFTAIGPTGNNPATVTLGSNTQVLSIGFRDESTENVLSTIIPAYIAVTSPPVTPTEITPTTSPGAQMKLSVDVSLHGIGNGGDNANPNNSSMSNKNPLHTTRDVSVQLYNSTDNLVGTYSGIMTYDPAVGDYTATVSADTPPAGAYQIKIQSKGYLKRLVSGIHSFNSQPIYNIPAVSLITGDVNNDNLINIMDYNMIIDCYSDLLPPISCNDAQKEITDLDDDSKVNQVDYNLFLREITVQHGY